MKPRRITSPQNQSLKEIAALRDTRHRRKRARILVDGSRDIRRAIEAGWRIETLVTCEPTREDEDLRAAIAAIQPSDAVDWIETTATVHTKVAYGESLKPVAVIEPQRWTWEDVIPPRDQPATLVVLDRVEKPGNIGAVLRCCDAFAASSVILSDPVCELFNPNAIRSSTGAIFWMPVIDDSADRVAARLTAAGFDLFAARVDSTAEDFATVDWPRRVALIFGSEADGLGPRWLLPNVRSIVIPMAGRVDSLNVSVATAVVLAAIVRNRPQ